MTITLIGMPAVGKSCMGKALGKKLKMRTIDGDKLIRSNTGRNLQDIIDEDGLEEFKRIEEETLLSIDDDNVIITPGGSAIFYPKVMEHFKKKGIVVYLYAGYDVIVDRLGDYSARGVVLEKGKTIRDLYDERTPLLEKFADIKVSCNGNAFARYKADALAKITEYIAHTPSTENIT